MLLTADRRPLALLPTGAPRSAEAAPTRPAALPCLPSAPRRTAQMELPLRPRR